MKTLFLIIILSVETYFYFLPSKEYPLAMKNPYTGIWAVETLDLNRMSGHHLWFFGLDGKDTVNTAFLGKEFQFKDSITAMNSYNTWWNRKYMIKEDSTFKREHTYQ